MLNKKQLEDQIQAFEDQAQIVLAQIAVLTSQIVALREQSFSGVEIETSIQCLLLERIAKNTIEALALLTKEFRLLPLDRRLGISRAALNIVPI